MTVMVTTKDNGKLAAAAMEMGYCPASAEGTGGEGGAEALLLQWQPPPAETEWGAGLAPLRDQVPGEVGGRQAP